RPKILHGSGFLSKRHRLFDFESGLSAIEKFCPCVTAAPGGPLTSDNGDPMINDAGKHEVNFCSLSILFNLISSSDQNILIPGLLAALLVTNHERTFHQVKL